MWPICGLLKIFTGLILGLRPDNERRRYKETPSLIGWAQSPVFGLAHQERADPGPCYSGGNQLRVPVVLRLVICSNIKNSRFLFLPSIWHSHYLLVRTYVMSVDECIFAMPLSLCPENTKFVAWWPKCLLFILCHFVYTYTLLEYPI